MSFDREEPSPITMETVVSHLFARFPILQTKYEIELDYMCDEPPLAYIVFGDIIIPLLESALRSRETELIASLCKFFEECAESAKKDLALGNLLTVEVGEWLARTIHEEQVAPFLGLETKRICSYVPGLATQRWKLRMEKQRSSLRQKASRYFKRS